MKYFLHNKDINKIQEHYDKYILAMGAESDPNILHELHSDDMHIDIAHYKPTKDFPYHVLGTIGMSGYTMKNAPFKNLELIMFLPEDWQIDEKSLQDEKWYWPIRLLKMVARLPYESDDIVSVGHTISMNEKFDPFYNCTKMSFGLLTFPTWINYDFFTLKYGLIPRKKINFLCLTAITSDEYGVFKKIGYEKFMEVALNKDGIDDLCVRNKR